MSAGAFREVKIAGTPDERGNAHGVALASEIESTIDFYATIFKKSTSKIFELAEHFRQVIDDFNPAYGREINGIAAGAKIREPLWIYALNARSELLSLDPSIGVNECTALYFRSAALLGQNWDWGRRLEDLAVLMEVTVSEGHRIQMLTEPGIIGKIGLNSRGLGTCLNILRIKKPLKGVPIHIVLRSILDSADMEEAKLMVRKSGHGKASNILLGDNTGGCCDVEFAGDESFLIHPQSEFMIHTNHYLAQNINPDEGIFNCSYSRLRVATEKARNAKDLNLQTMREILLDRSDCSFPICREYKFHKDVEEMGTVATIIMDLNTKQLHIRRGNEVDSDSSLRGAEDSAEEFKVAFEAS